MDDMIHAFVGTLEKNNRLTPQAAGWINQALQQVASSISVPIPMANSANEHPFFEVNHATEQRSTHFTDK
jgi:hypothetical protein